MNDEGRAMKFLKGFVFGAAVGFATGLSMSDRQWQELVGRTRRTAVETRGGGSP
ncbi:MAG: hypothetical protein ACO23O_03275 [Ilumatobacteraceae bacterium]